MNIEDLIQMLDQSYSAKVPIHMIEELSYERWAIKEVIQYSLDHPEEPLPEIIENYAFKMMVFEIEARTERVKRIFRIAKETLESFVAPPVDEPF